MAAVSVGLQVLIDNGSEYAPTLPHHYGMHALGVVVGFAVVFRTNLGWSRYWEAVGQLHIMYSKWGDAFSQVLAFATVTVERAAATQTDAGDATCERVEAILEELMRNFILMSAISAHRLTHGDTQRMEVRAKKSSWKHQIVKRETLRKEDITGAWVLPSFEPEPEDLMLGVDVIEDTVDGSGEHTPHTTEKETSVSHSRSLRWENRNSLTSVPSEGLRNSRRRIQQRKIQEGINAWDDAKFLVKAMPTVQETDLLRRSTDRCTVVMYWIIHGLAKLSPYLDIAPPIQSRMYQELSSGMLAYNQSMKLADVPFPFPYAQMLTIILVAYICFIPVYVVIFTQSMIVGPMISFTLCLTIWGLNETAKELENPFGPDHNDILLNDFHLRFYDLCHEVYEAHLVKSPARRRNSRTKQRSSDCSSKASNTPVARSPT